MLFENTSDETKIVKNPISFKIGLIFALLGLATPFLVFLVARIVFRMPCCGEESNPADGLGWMLVMIGGIIWWTFAGIISFISALAGIVRKETGRIKIFTIAASALSLILIVSVYAGAFALVRHVQNETKRYEATKKL